MSILEGMATVYIGDYDEFEGGTGIYKSYSDGRVLIHVEDEP
jgi:hypothetical protein